MECTRETHGERQYKRQCRENDQPRAVLAGHARLQSLPRGLRVGSPRANAPASQPRVCHSCQAVFKDRPTKALHPDPLFPFRLLTSLLHVPHSIHLPHTPHPNTAAPSDLHLQPHTTQQTNTIAESPWFSTCASNHDVDCDCWTKVV